MTMKDDERRTAPPANEKVPQNAELPNEMDDDPDNPVSVEEPA